MSKKIKYHELKEIVLKAVKNHLKKMKNESDTETAPVKTPPKTTPDKKPNPLKIPKPGPNTRPNPKAEDKGQEVVIKGNGVNEIKKFLKENDERIRFRRMLNEAPPMDIDNPRYGEPASSFKSGIEGAGPSPFSDIEFLQKRQMNKSTLEKLGSEEFNSIVNTLIDAGDLNMQAIYTSLQSIMTIESRHKRQLEELAIETVARNFGLPDEVKEMIVARLTPDENIEMDGDDENPIEAVEAELTDEEKELAKKYIDKRKIQNALMMGSGYRAHKLFDGVKASLDAIDDRLYPLYEKFMPNVEFQLWKIEMPVAGRQNWGKCEIDKESGKGKAQAKLFLILLHETAKIAVELLFLQSIEDIAQEHGEEMSKYVISQADKYEEEQWMKLIGPRLWKYLHDCIDYIVKERNNDYSIISYLLNKIGMLAPDDFLQLMDEVVNDGATAIQKLETMVDELEKEIEDYRNQNDEMPEPEDITGELDMNKIGDLVSSALDDILGKKTETGVPEKLVSKKLPDMSIDELNTYLAWAIENEEYEKAAEARNEINRR
jgi:polyhydroxyalkanoate synthesis regulator phasin